MPPTLAWSKEHHEEVTWSDLYLARAKVCDPTVVECTRNCYCFNVFDWSSYRPTDKSVDESYTVFVPIRFRQGVYYVHVRNARRELQTFPDSTIHGAILLLAIHAVLVHFAMSRCILSHNVGVVRDLWTGCRIVEYIENSIAQGRRYVRTDCLIGHLTIEHGVRQAPLDAFHS